MDGKVPERQAERQIAAIRKQERTLGQRLGRLRHGLPVRDRGLPGRGAGTDWGRADVRERYRGMVSWWLRQQIAQTRDHPS